MPNITALDPFHRQWLAQCVITQVDDATITSTLIAQGFSAELIQAELAEAHNHPYIAAGITLARTVKKRDWLLHTLKLVQMNGEQTPSLVTFTEWPDAVAFRDFFYSANRPCLLKGVAKNWPAVTAWTDTLLKDRIGNAEVEVQWGRSEDPIYEHNATLYKSRMPFHQFVDTVNQTPESNDFYLTSNNAGANGAVFDPLWQDVPLTELDPYLRTTPELGLQPEEPLGYFWYGPKGTITHLHHDLTSGFLVQVRGRKLVKLISSLEQPNMYPMLNYYSPVNAESPDYQQFPLYAHVKPIEVIIEPGDVLFIPVGWWHYVRALESSISLSFTNFHWPNGYTSFYDCFGLHPIDPLLD